MKTWNVIRENLGLKIGVATGVAILVVVLLLVAAFGSVPVALISKLSMIQILLVMGVFIAAISFLVISIVTTLLVQRPLDRLMGAIRQAESGDLQPRIFVDSPDEIGQVAFQFNEMLSKIKGLEENRVQSERRLTMAQEELRYQAVLEEKANIISSTNLKLEDSLRELSVLYNISQVLTAHIDPEELCNQLGDVIVRNISLDDFAILLFDEESKKLQVKTARGFQKNDKIQELTFDFDEGVSGHAAKTKRVVYIDDTSKDKHYLHYKGIKTGTGSFLCVPMLAKDSFLGVINFSRKEVGSFSDQEIRMLSVVAGQVAISLENARLYAKTKELSLIDDLTRAYNRRHFHKILDMEFKRAKRFNRSLSLLMIDVDHFKHFNDSLGHLEGDRLLVKLAATLNASLREVDTVARYGGEEFAVILPNTSLQDAEKVGNKLRKAVEEIHVLRPKGSRKKVTVSIGISSLFSDASSLDDLINHADIALYKAKSQGRNLVIAYESIGLASLRVVE
jgi:diguanylate cyclase (GGDEF)-like protein